MEFFWVWLSQILAKRVSKFNTKFQSFGLQVAEAVKIFWRFLTYLAKSGTLGNLKAHFLPPKQNSRYLGATGTNFIQIVLNTASGGLKCLHRSSLCHILCYPIFYKEIKKSNEKIKHWYPKKCKRKQAQRLE